MSLYVHCDGILISGSLNRWAIVAFSHKDSQRGSYSNSLLLNTMQNMIYSLTIFFYKNVWLLKEYTSLHKLTLRLNKKHNDCWTIKFQWQINLKIAIDIKTRTAAMHKEIKCLCNSIILNQLSSTDNNTNRTRQSILERHLHIRSKISMQHLYIRSIAKHT